MWRRWFPAFLLAIIALFIGGYTALADAQTTSSSTTVTLQGQASIVQNPQGRQLRLKLSSMDRTQWLLEVILNPQRIGNDNYGNQYLVVNGTFTLGTSRQPISSGTSTGQLKADESGNISLADPASSIALNLLFTIQPDGSATSTVQGQWPSQPSSPGQVQATNHNFWFISRTSALMAVKCNRSLKSA